MSTIGKKLLNTNISSTCLMVNFGTLTAETYWRVLGTPANFNRFRVLPSLLQRRRSPEANQTSHHDVWPSPGMVQYVYIFGAVAPTEFCPVQYSLYVQVLRLPIGLLAALLHGTPAVQQRASAKRRRRTRNGIKELSQRAPPTPCFIKTGPFVISS